MMSSEDEGLILHLSSWIETSVSVHARPTPTATLVVQCATERRNGKLTEPASLCSCASPGGPRPARAQAAA